MTVKAAFLLPSSPLPYFRPDNPPWQPLHAAMQLCGERVAALKPDVLIVYPTSWIAVLDQQWQARKQLSGEHVDHNWFEYGELRYDLRADTELVASCVAAANLKGLHSKAVDYDQFPIDTGTIVAMNYLNGQGRIPVVITSNNVYHDAAKTRQIAATAIAAAAAQGKSAVVVAIGELSGEFYRHDIDISQDRVIVGPNGDLNQPMLDHLVRGDFATFSTQLDDYARRAKVDFGFKHMHFLLEAVGGKPKHAELLAYAPLYGKGGAVLQLTP